MPQLNDTGTTLQVTVTDLQDETVDLTDATATFVFKKPSGAVSTGVGIVTEPTNGIVQYTFEDGLLDEVGIWSWQVSLLQGLKTWNTAVKTFMVYENL